MGVLMDEFVITKGAWFVDAEAPEFRDRELAHFRGSHEVLLAFLRQEGLLQNPRFGEVVEDWYNFEIRTSDLTDEGLELFKLCHHKWAPAYGQENTKRHLVQWKRRLKEMRDAV